MFRLCITLSVVVILADHCQAVPSVQKRQSPSETCKGIVCRDQPKLGHCEKEDPSPEQKGTIGGCCPNWVCKDDDGTVSKHSGVAGGGSEEKEYIMKTTDGKPVGKMKTKHSSSFSSSSSKSEGPGAAKHIEFKPMQMHHIQMQPMHMQMQPMFQPHHFN